MSLWHDKRSEGIIKTLREAGLSTLQINNAFAVLEGGGSATEAEEAIYLTPFPVIANFELELMLVQMQRELELVERNEATKS